MTRIAVFEQFRYPETLRSWFGSAGLVLPSVHVADMTFRRPIPRNAALACRILLRAAVSSEGIRELKQLI